jgi:glutamate-5-semialdehyde dehydrogenase
MNAFNVAEHMQALGLQAREASARMAAARRMQATKALLKALARCCAKPAPLAGRQPQGPGARHRRRPFGADGRPPQAHPKIIETVAVGCEQLAAMADVIGDIIGMKQQPSGIRVGQMRVPIGVFGMIYESRPNVTIEAASLAIKSGNACILRGGSEAIESNKALARAGAAGAGRRRPAAEAVQLVQTTDREAVGHLIAMPEYVDVIIPRGGKGLIERISRDAKVPVIKHLDGNCHVYVDDPATSRWP